MAIRAVQFSSRGILAGCPLPVGVPSPPPPPPPPPAAPTIPTGTISETGTLHNGPGAYEGFKATGTGSVRVYSGPDTSYPLVHEELNPTAGTWYYAPGVTPNDPSTFIEVQGGHCVLGGVGQTVEGAFHDFVLSLYAEDTEEDELNRLEALFTGQTFYWKAKSGVGVGDGSVGNPFNGAKQLNDAIAAGTVNDGDRVVFDFVNGPVTPTTDGAEWPCAVGTTSAFSGGDARRTTAGDQRGIIFGTAMGASSTASNIWFDFGDGSQIAYDWRNNTSSNRRAIAAMRFQGEGILVTGCKGYQPNWNFLINPADGTRRCPSASNAEDASYENNGIMIYGNGSWAFNCEALGDKTFCNIGIGVFPSNPGVAGATGYMRGGIAYCRASGQIMAFVVRPYGTGGYDFQVPTGVLMHHNTCSDPGWGHEPGYLDLSGGTHGGNATAHGNGISCQGKWFGNAHIYENDVTGFYQDACAGSAAGVIVYDNYFHTINRCTSKTIWQYSGGLANWTTATSTNNEGNGVKTGLTNLDRISGTAWLKNDGTASTVSGSMGVQELRWVVVRNIIRDCQGAGITSNESNGGFIAFNEVYDCYGPCLLILGQSKTSANTSRDRQNWYVMNNVFWKITTGSSGHAVRVESSANPPSTQGPTVTRLWFYNNIVRAGTTQTEINVVSPGVVVDARNNVFVNNRVFGTYSTANDLVDASSRAAAALYVPSTGGDATNAGLPVGNILRTAGSTVPYTAARSFGRYLDLRGNPINTSTPPIGPCLAP